VSETDRDWGPPADPVGDSGAAALAHLQAAVLEMLAASRAALDVVENLVRDPDAMAPLVNTATGLGQVVADLLRERVRGSDPTAGPAQPDKGDGVQRIRIS
jgi:hypothetical protein